MGESSFARERDAQARDRDLEIRVYAHAVELDDCADALLLFSSEQTEVDRRDPEARATTESNSALEERLRDSLEERLRDFTALQELCAKLDQRLLRVEDMLQRVATAVASTSLQEEHASIAMRVARTEELLRRIEHVLAARSASVSYGWVAALKRLVAHRTAMSRVRTLLLLSVVAVVAAVVKDPTMRSEGAVNTSSELAIPLSPVQVAKPLSLPLALRIPPIESRSKVALASPPKPAAIQSKPKESAAGRTVAAQRAAPAQNVGVLEVESEPAGASVFINRRPVGVTPLTLPEHPVGSLALQVTMEGFQRWSAAVQVTAGRSTRVTATLRPGSP